MTALSRRHTLALLGGGLAAGTARADTPHNTIAIYAGLASKLWRNAVAIPYTKATGVRTEIFESTLPASSIAQAAGQPQFNAAIIAAYAAPGLIKRGLLETFTPDELPGIRNVPERYWQRTPDGKLFGMMVYFGIDVIIYNTDLAKPSDFASWYGLLDPKWRGQLSMSRPSFVAAYDLNMYAKIGGGDESHLDPGYDFLKKLVPNVLSEYTSMSSLQQQVGRGEVVASPFSLSETVLLKREGVKNVDFAIPKEGGIIQPFILAIPKGAPYIDEAKKLLNAVIEPGYQRVLAESSLVWPMNPKTVLSTDLVKEMGGTADDLLARNFLPNYWIIGSDLEARTRRVDDIQQGAQ